MSHQIPAGAPKIAEGRKDYERRACGTTIPSRQVRVSIRDCAPQRDSTGKARTKLRAKHYTVHYHIKCFTKSQGGSDQRTNMLSYNIRELEGYSRYRDEVECLLRDDG
jgi:hypothetical protein